MFPQHFKFAPDSTCTWASLTRQKQETFFLFLNYQSTQPTHILLFEILIKPMQDNNIGGLFLPTVLPPSVIISVSATRRLPIIPVPISVTAILLFMNDNYYLVVFKNKKKSCTAHDLKEFLLFTPCYHLVSTVVLPLIHLTPRPWILKNLEITIKFTSNLKVITEHSVSIHLSVSILFFKI